MKQKLTELKETMSSYRLIVGDLHMPLTIIDKITRQNFNKEKRGLEQYYRPTRPKDIYRTLYTFFSSALGTFSKLEYILGHKRSLNKF